MLCLLNKDEGRESSLKLEDQHKESLQELIPKGDRF